MGKCCFCGGGSADYVYQDDSIGRGAVACAECVTRGLRDRARQCVASWMKALASLDKSTVDTGDALPWGVRLVNGHVNGLMDLDAHILILSDVLAWQARPTSAGETRVTGETKAL
mgnify:FL=1